MERNDELLQRVPSALRGLAVTIIMAVIPTVMSAMKAIHGINQSLQEMEKSLNNNDSLQTDDVTNVTKNPWQDYLIETLPKRLEKLLAKPKQAAILLNVNNTFKKLIIEDLKEKLISLESKLSQTGIKKTILEYINNNKLLNNVPNKIAGTTRGVLLSTDIYNWIIAYTKANLIQKRPSQTMADASATTTADAQTRRTRTRPASENNSGTTRDRVLLGSVNTIGNVHIPKSIYNFLALGAKFCIERAQARPDATTAEAVVQQVTARQFRDLNTNQINKLKDANITSEMIAEIQKLFEFIVAHSDGQVHINELWHRFIHSDLKAMQLDQSLFDTNKRAPLKRLTSFLTNRRYVAKLADKNAGLTVMPFEWYYSKGNEHVSDTETYSKVRSVSRQSIIAGINQICAKYKVPNKWTREDDTIVSPQIYFMPKVHKTPIGIRPIIPSHSWFTTRAAKWVHQQLFPIIKHYNWIVTDRLQLVQELENLTMPHNKVKLATVDVTALYTSIDLNKGMEIIRLVLDGKYQDGLDFLLDLLHWVLTNNFFKFDNKWYQQTKGAAMGGNASGIFADLVLAGLEEQIFKQMNTNDRPLLYRRYRDDILLVDNSHKRIMNHIMQLNGQNMLKYNLEQYGNSVNYLDITVSKGAKFAKFYQFDIQPYIKPTNQCKYTNFATYKPELTKTAWITGECIRILRACQSEKKYRVHMRQLKQRLLRDGYPNQVIRSKMKYQFRDRNWLLSKTTKDDNLKWYSMNTTRHAHEKWNFLQNNCKSLLQFHNIRITAHKGKTILDALNKCAKDVQRIPTRENHEQRRLEQLAIAAQRERQLRLDLRQQDRISRKRIRKSRNNNFWQRELRRFVREDIIQNPAQRENPQIIAPNQTDSNSQETASNAADVRLTIPRRTRQSSRGASLSPPTRPRKRRATSAVT